MGGLREQKYTLQRVFIGGWRVFFFFFLYFAVTCFKARPVGDLLP